MAINDDRMNKFYFARQPIIDSNARTLGYELLFRSSCNNAYDKDFAAEKATAQVLVNAIFEAGLESVVGSAKAFINLPQYFFEHPDLLLMVDPSRCVLEVLEGVEVTDEVFNGVKKLTENGYTIALDDFVDPVQFERLIPLAQIIKYDITDHTIDALAAYRSKDVEAGRLSIAERVETREEYDALLEVGFEHFQGYYFAKPRVVSGAKLPQDKITFLQLLAQVLDLGTELDELSETLSRDVGLSIRTLRYLNSPVSGLMAKVTSIKQAVMLLGRENLRNWLVLMSMSGVDDKPPELTKMALIRARFCQLYAKEKGFDNDAMYFMIGLLSMLGALVDADLGDALNRMSVSDDIRSQLLDHSGYGGHMLELLAELEKRDPVIGQEHECVGSLYQSAVQWSEQIYQTLS